MKTLSDIRQEVAQRADAGFVGALMPLAEAAHARHGFKSGCECSYCVGKRRYSRLGGWRQSAREYKRQFKDSYMRALK
jgi:hypothetical protein